MDDATLREVSRAVAGVEGVIVVDSRVLRRVVKHHLRLPGLGLQVPHAFSYAIPRDALFEIVGSRDLGGREPSSMPAFVSLVPRPSAEEVADADEALRSLWRAAFHARVHVVLEQKLARGALTDAAIRERIHRLGHAEFDEIRIGLKQDDRLVSRDDRAAWIELAATYAELRRFAPAAVAHVFPVLHRLDATDALLAEDFDADALLAATKPEGAGEAAPRAVHRPSLAPPAPKGRVDPPMRTALVARAKAATARGNRVRAALSLFAAADAGGGDGSNDDLREARADLASLAVSLDHVLGGAVDLAGGHVAWARAFEALARAAIEGGRALRSPPARALFDVQAACIEAERTPKTVELAAYLRSFGRKPIVRSLPAAREVRVLKRLRAAEARATRAKLSREVRAEVGELFHLLRRRAADNLDRALVPRVETALVDSGLSPKNAVERAAVRGAAARLALGVEERGFFGIGQLRDAISRSDKKLGGLTAKELLFGDALLTADRKLGASADGVYREGEIYLRGLQKASSLAFGTPPGRAFSLYVALPCVVAYVALVGVTHLIALIARVELELLNYWSFGILAAFVFAMLHVDAFRRGVFAALRAIASALHAVFVAFPRWLATRPVVAWILASGPLRAVFRFVVRPAVPATLVHFAARGRLAPNVVLGADALVFATAMLALNSPVGLLAEEAVWDYLALRVHWLTRHLIPGLFRLVGSFFRRGLEGLERGIYAVDEWLRFRQGEHPVALVSKVFFGFVWFFVAYVLRFATNLLIEPQINPIKHFPVVTVSHKIIWSFAGKIIGTGTDVLGPLIGKHLAEAILSAALLIVPGFFGFLVWELKENYRLYEKNRAPTLSPALIGHHGETMSGLLRPGFHSGTVPKLFAKLRRAASEGRDGASSAAAEAAIAGHEEAIEEVREAVARFVEQSIVAVVRESRGGALREISLASVELAASRVRIAFAREGSSAELVVHLEEQSGRLVAGVAEAGFADDLDDTARLALENAIAGLYRFVGADHAREVIDAAVGGAAYDLADEGLVVWPGPGYRTELVYSLARPIVARAVVRGEAPASEPPALDVPEISLRDQPILYVRWVEAWESPTPTRLTGGASLLPPKRQAPGAIAAAQ